MAGDFFQEGFGSQRIAVQAEGIAPGEFFEFNGIGGDGVHRKVVHDPQAVFHFAQECVRNDQLLGFIDGQQGFAGGGAQDEKVDVERTEG